MNNQFQASPEYIEITMLLRANGVMHQTATFACLAEGVITYQLIGHDITHEFNLISDDDFLNEMEVFDLLKQSRLVFFHVFYLY